MVAYESWGSYPRSAPSQIRELSWRPKRLSKSEFTQPVLAHGLGRSQGDSCLNNNGILLDTRRLDHFISFNESTGILRCESGVTLSTILELIVPRGWFLPVTPGTKYVTVGGAIANDVHGKNHARAGTFGNYVTQFELLRSDETVQVCTPTENPGLFSATIGGLGLTGLITWAELKLKRIPSPFIDVRNIPFKSLDEYFELHATHVKEYEYCIAQFDATSHGRAAGRGILLCGNHSTRTPEGMTSKTTPRSISIPFTTPAFTLNRFSISAYNRLYFHRQRAKVKVEVVPYDPYFFPLDSIAHWNRLYGKRGFLQYQCVVPASAAKVVFKSILAEMQKQKLPSYLASLKYFGTVKSPGLLSFPMAGHCIALDFPMTGPRTLKIFDYFDELVREVDGRVYPAKDAHMSTLSFQKYFPEWTNFSRWVDPAFSSSFWRRVTAQP